MSLLEGELLPREEIERKQESISINIYGQIVFQNLLGESQSIYDYLALDENERIMVDKLENNQEPHEKDPVLRLIGERIDGEPYPKYIISFIEENFSHIIDGEEVNYKRASGEKELIFIKIKLPESLGKTKQNTTVSPEIIEETFSFKKMAQDVLAGIGLGK